MPTPDDLARRLQAGDATALNSLADFRLEGPRNNHHDARTHVLHESLTQLYAHGNDAVTLAGRETLAVLSWLTLGAVVVARLGWGWRGRLPRR